MCARYYVPQTPLDEEDDRDLERELLEAENRGRLKDPAFRLKRGEIRPGDMAAVIARGRQTGKAAAYPMLWGFHTAQGLVFNARSESIADKPIFSESFRHRRCLVPMNAYFEWDHRQKPMIKYQFAPLKRRSWFAGLYRFEAEQPVFTILTRPAATDIADFHDRMPVMLEATAGNLWLLGSQEEAAKALYASLEELRYGAVC